MSNEETAAKREEDVEGKFDSSISRVTEERADHGYNDIITMGKPRYPLCLIRESGRDGGVPGKTGMLAKKCTLQQIVVIFHNTGNAKFNIYTLTQI